MADWTAARATRQDNQILVCSKVRIMTIVRMMAKRREASYLLHEVRIY